MVNSTTSWMVETSRCSAMCLACFHGYGVTKMVFVHVCAITPDALHVTRDTARSIVAPANNAILNNIALAVNNIALAVVFHRGFRHLPEANLHFMMRRREALDAILSPH